MKKILKERGQGKTYDLIKISSEKNIPIICYSYGSMTLICEMAEEMGVEIPTPIPIHKYIEMINGGYNPERILIDNAEFIMEYLLRCEIYALSMTKPKIITKREIADILNIHVDELEIVD